jgi:hypothetical protein
MPKDTEITDSEGNTIENVSSATIYLDGKDPATVTLDIILPMVDIHGILEKIDLHCPACGIDFEHICKRDSAT